MLRFCTCFLIFILYEDSKVLTLDFQRTQSLRWQFLCLQLTGLRPQRGYRKQRTAEAGAELSCRHHGSLLGIHGNLWSHENLVESFQTEKGEPTLLPPHGPRHRVQVTTGQGRTLCAGTPYSGWQSWRKTQLRPATNSTSRRWENECLDSKLSRITLTNHKSQHLL